MPSSQHHRWKLYAIAAGLLAATGAVVMYLVQAGETHTGDSPASSASASTPPSSGDARHADAPPAAPMSAGTVSPGAAGDWADLEKQRAALEKRLVELQAALTNFAHQYFIHDPNIEDPASVPTIDSDTGRKQWEKRTANQRITTDRVQNDQNQVKELEWIELAEALRVLDIKDSPIEKTFAEYRRLFAEEAALQAKGVDVDAPERASLRAQMAALEKSVRENFENIRRAQTVKLQLEKENLASSEKTLAALDEPQKLLEQYAILKADYLHARAEQIATETRYRAEWRSSLSPGKVRDWRQPATATPGR